MNEAADHFALLATLRSIPSRVPIDRLERVWIFPQREFAARKQRGLLVLSIRPPEPYPDDARDLVTIEYEVERAIPPTPPTITATEQGHAPAGRLSRVLHGVISRLGDADEPLEFILDGDPARWAVLLRRYGSEVDRGNGE